MTWKYRTNTTINDPNDGNVRFNDLDLTRATELAVAHKTQQGTDVSAEIAELLIGESLTMTAIADASRWVRFDVAALPVPLTTWSSIAIVYRASNTPTFADADEVTLRPIGTDMPVLVTLQEARWQVHITDPARDGELTMLMKQASSLIIDYIGAQADPSWDEATAPDDVKAGTLRVLAHLWEHRGDDASEDHDLKVWEAVSLLLMRRRDPALA